MNTVTKDRLARSLDAQMSALSKASEISPELTRLLIKAGADVNIPSHNGGVLALSSKCTLHSASLLLRAGNEINIFNHNKVNTLKRHIAEEHPHVQREVCTLLYAAGEIIDGFTVEKFHQNGTVTQVEVLNFLCSLFCLKHLCRETIRRHLINLDPHMHLFGTILAEYLLYDVSLERIF